MTDFQAAVPWPIELPTWPRRELFEHYLHDVPCSYALAADVDVTRLAAALAGSDRRTYLAHVWALATVVNRHDEFRLSLRDDDQPAVWDVVHPLFTVFNPDRETFCAVWTPWDPDFGRFHERAAPLLSRYRSATTMFPQDDRPPNTFDVSSLPWTSFTGFTLQIREPWRHLAPIFTLGRQASRGGVDPRLVLPLAVQIHHAAADGFHTARLLAELGELLSSPDWVR